MQDQEVRTCGFQELEISLGRKVPSILRSIHRARQLMSSDRFTFWNLKIQHQKWSHPWGVKVTPLNLNSKTGWPKGVFLQKRSHLTSQRKHGGERNDNRNTGKENSLSFPEWEREPSHNLSHPLR